MYEKGPTIPSTPLPLKEAEHISIARDIANDLMSKFGEFQQNECLSVIRQMFIERRQENIKEVGERMKFLQDSLSEINKPH